MSNIVHRELLEEELKAVVRAGGYRSKREAVRHALEVLLAANPDLRIRTAVELYRHGKVTLARGAEVAGLELEAFKEKLAAEEIPLLVDESPEEVQAGADLIHRLRRAQ
jgi:predicted HTH domain antitoxin